MTNNSKISNFSMTFYFEQGQLWNSLYVAEFAPYLSMKWNGMKPISS